jgi:hypothetical protein
MLACLRQQLRNPECNPPFLKIDNYLITSGNISMDERLEKAFEVANYMATLSNQKRLIKEELDQKLVYYTNGGSFKVDQTLISFTKTIIEFGHTEDVVLLDVNQLPIIINNVPEFLNNIVNVYFESVNDYSAKVTEIKSKRKLTDIVEL